MIDFKFEKGKYYRSRNGIKYKCVDINMGKIKQVLLVDLDDFTIRVDISSGKYDVNSKSNGDIIGIWEEPKPKPKRLCYRNKETGVLGVYSKIEIDCCDDPLERYPCALDEV